MQIKVYFIKGFLSIFKVFVSKLSEEKIKFDELEPQRNIISVFKLCNNQ
jgi:hypothetical protein